MTVRFDAYAEAEGGGLCFVDAEMNQPVRFVPNKPNRGLQWSPHGKLIVARDNRTVYLMDPESAEVVRKLEATPDLAGPVVAFSLSGDGRIIATTYHNPTTSLVFDVETGNLLRTLKHNVDEAQMIPMYNALSPDGKILIFKSRSGNKYRVERWDLETEQMISGGSSKFDSEWLEWSPDGKSQVQGWYYGAMVHSASRQWEWAFNCSFEPGAGAGRLELHAWLHAEDILVGGNTSGGIYVWDVSSPELATGQQRPPLLYRKSVPLTLGTNYMSCLSPSPSLPLIAISAGAVFRIWEPRTGRIRAAIMEFAGDPAATLVFSGDGHYRVMGDFNDQFVYVVRTDQGEQLTLTADEFAQRYGWKNDSAGISLKGKPARQPAEDATCLNGIEEPEPANLSQAKP